MGSGKSLPSKLHTRVSVSGWGQVLRSPSILYECLQAFPPLEVDVSPADCSALGLGLNSGRQTGDIRQGVKLSGKRCRCFPCQLQIVNTPLVRSDVPSIRARIPCNHPLKGEPRLWFSGSTKLNVPLWKFCLYCSNFQKEFLKIYQDPPTKIQEERWPSWVRDNWNSTWVSLIGCVRTLFNEAEFRQVAAAPVHTVNPKTKTCTRKHDFEWALTITSYHIRQIKPF